MLMLITGAVLMLAALGLSSAAVPIPAVVGSLAWIAGIILLFAGGFSRYYARRDRLRRAVLANGVAGTARIVAVRQNQVLKRQTSLYLQLEVQVPGREAYRAAMVIPVATGAVSSYAVGDTLRVRVDPARRFDVATEPDQVPRSSTDAP